MPLLTPSQERKSEPRWIWVAALLVPLLLCAGGALPCLHPVDFRLGRRKAHLRVVSMPTGRTVIKGDFLYDGGTIQVRTCGPFVVIYGWTQPETFVDDSFLLAVLRHASSPKP